MIVNDSNPELQRWESPRAGRKHAPRDTVYGFVPASGSPSVRRGTLFFPLYLGFFRTRRATEDLCGRPADAAKPAAGGEQLGIRRKLSPG